MIEPDARCKNCGHAYKVHWQEDYDDSYGVYTGCDGHGAGYPGLTEFCQCTMFEQL